MSKGTITIRAAGLSRFVKTIHTVTSDDPEFLFGNPETKDIFNEIVKKETLAFFYTKDVELLAKVFTDILAFYTKRPVIYSKINLLWCAQETSSLLVSHAGFASINARSKETKNMNKAFYELNELVRHRQEVSSTVEFIKVNDANFRADSEYVDFKVEY